MKPFVVLASLACLLTGCASYSPSIPEGYVGPQATIKDSATVHSASKVDYFYVAKIDGKIVNNSRAASLAANQGRGFQMSPVILTRDVPARPLTLDIVARTEYAAPILALTSTVYQVAGQITFTPAASKFYVVRGILSAEYAAVWIEDQESRQIVDKKIEAAGSAKLGFFQK